MRLRRTSALATLIAVLAAAPAVAAPADLDPSFDGDGIVTLREGWNTPLSGLALSGGGVAGLVAIGGPSCLQEAVVRWRDDGSPDPAFSSDGVSESPDGGGRQCDRYPEGLAAGPGGRLVTFGTSFTGVPSETTRFIAARDEDGAPITTFGQGGILFQDHDESYLEDVATLPDGRLVAAHRVYGENRSVAGWDLRWHGADGAPQPPFGPTLNWASGTTSFVGAITAGDGGEVIVAGHHPLPGDLTIARSGLAVARVRPDGTLDPGFGDGGIARHEEPYDSFHVRDVLITPEDEVLVAGEVYRHREGYPYDSRAWFVARFTSEGELDPTFGAGGRLHAFQAPGTYAAEAIALDDRGRIVVAGVGPYQSFGVGRFLSNGSVDDTFGDRGLFRIEAVEPGMTSAGANAVVVQPDGKIVAGGDRTQPGGGEEALVVRLQGGDVPPPPGRDTPVATDETGGTIGGDGAAPAPPAPPSPERGSRGRVRFRLLSSRVRRGGVLVRVTWPRGTDGYARARLWTRNKGILLGQRRVRARPPRLGRTFRVPLNRRAKRLVASGRKLRIVATVRVTGLPAP